MIQPVAEAARIVREAGGWLHVDAVQSAGKHALDFSALGVDTLALSAHKLGGPQGVGALVAVTARQQMLQNQGNSGCRSPSISMPNSRKTCAVAVLELEDVLATSWQNAAAIEAYVDRFRGEPEIVPVALPDMFKGELRHYQQEGVDWLQHLASHGLGGFLADDMGLGKTAQTIAHITVEFAAGRMKHPALIVVPTSLVANWNRGAEEIRAGVERGGAARHGPA